MGPRGHAVKASLASLRAATTARKGSHWTTSMLMPTLSIGAGAFRSSRAVRGTVFLLFFAFQRLLDVIFQSARIENGENP